MTQKIYDLIGIGLGPFNLSLNALLDSKKEEVDYLFLEKNEEFAWHEGMILDGTTLQVPFMADLVTMVDPTSPYTYLNYLAEKGRLFNFYFYESFFIPRKDYNNYCKWAAKKMGNINYNSEVRNIELLDGLYHISIEGKETLIAKNISVGVGSSPFIPEALKKVESENIFHNAHFKYKEESLKNKSVVVIGSGQSAAECVLSLLNARDNYKDLYWVTRSNGFFPMEYSKLGLEYFSSDYTDFFYSLKQETKDDLLKKQSLLYKGISFGTIADIYNRIYELTLEQENPLHLAAMFECTEASQDNDSITVAFKQKFTGEIETINVDAVVCATGYFETAKPFLAGLDKDLIRDEKGRLDISRDFKVTTKNAKGTFYIQNGELHTHGVGTPDLGLGAYRSAVIVNDLLGRECYKITKKNVFQNFGHIK